MLKPQLLVDSFVVHAIFLLAVTVSAVEVSSQQENKTKEKSWRQIPPSQRPIAIQQKELTYSGQTGVLTRILPATKIVSHIFQGNSPPFNYLNAAGEDMGIRWNATELIRHANPRFQTETHKVETEDGYILTLFRIKNALCTRNVVPVFFQHGFLGSADQWLLLDPEFNLPYILAGAGVDVWLGAKFFSPKMF